MNASPHFVLTINFVIAISCLWLGMWMYFRYGRLANFDKYRFRLFAIRDRLSLLVMRGVIKENSNEHITLLKLLNGAIESTETFKVTVFIRYVVYVSKNPEIKRRLERMYSTLKSNGDQTRDYAEFASCVSDFFSVVGEKVDRDMMMFRVVVFIMQKTRLPDSKRIQKRSDDLTDTRKYIKTWHDHFTPSYADGCYT